MTESQLLTSLEALLVAQTWTGSSNVVFPTGCVTITANADLATIAAVKGMRTPFALLQPLDSTSDPEFDEDPNFVALRLKVRLGVQVPGDGFGRNPLMGANKTGGSTLSEGRGLFEVEQELFNAIGKVNGLESINLQCRQKGAVEAGYVDGGSTYMATRDYDFEALGTMV